MKDAVKQMIADGTDNANVWLSFYVSVLACEACVDRHCTDSHWTTERHADTYTHSLRMAGLSVGCLFRLSSMWLMIFS